MEIRKTLEQEERKILSSDAKFADESAGRPVYEPQCPFRTVFQRDTDRIIHSFSFSRLKEKTQVFLSPLGDHYITRLTHTLQVAQIARTIARALRLNENLTEAIALGHDVGHTPFGHAGEWALDDMCEGGFKHFKQSVRTLMRLEKGGIGLNLTAEVTDGIANHTTGEWPSSLEGRVTRLSDKIAYLNHDIEDAVRAGIISPDDIPKDVRDALGDTKSKRITAMVEAIVANGIKTGRVGFGGGLDEYVIRLSDFMFERVYKNPVAKGEEEKAVEMVKTLFGYYMKNPDKLPADSIDSEVPLWQSVADHVSGMTDRYAIYTFESLFIPKPWNARR